jgi:hypothetical protein
VFIGLKKNKSNIVKLKISKDQKREKLRINFLFVFSVKNNIKTPIRGEIIKQDNIL